MNSTHPKPAVVTQVQVTTHDPAAPELPELRPWAASRLSISTAIAAEPRTAPTWRVAL